MAIEIVDLPMKNGWIFHSHSYVNVYQRVYYPVFVGEYNYPRTGKWWSIEVLTDLGKLNHDTNPSFSRSLESWWILGKSSTFMAARFRLPSGKRLHSYGNSPFSMGKSTISMAIFNSYVKLPEVSDVFLKFTQTDVSSSCQKASLILWHVVSVYGGFTSMSIWHVAKIYYGWLMFITDRIHVCYIW